MWFIKNDKIELKKDTMKIPPNAYNQTLVPPMSFLVSIFFMHNYCFGRFTLTYL